MIGPVGDRWCPPEGSGSLPLPALSTLFPARVAPRRGRQHLSPISAATLNAGMRHLSPVAEVRSEVQPKASHLGVLALQGGRIDLCRFCIACSWPPAGGKAFLRKTRGHSPSCGLLRWHLEGLFVFDL